MLVRVSFVYLEEEYASARTVRGSTIAIIKNRVTIA